MSPTSSLGNGIFPNGPTMRQPSMSWLYRLECSTEDIELGAPHNGDTIRSIANIVRGSVKGPGIEGEILPLGGADWATVVKGTHVSNPLHSALFLSRVLRFANGLGHADSK
jgi:hypothetical protein